MVCFYGDESESHQPHVFTLAGFVASPSAWSRFVPAWREMLRSFGAHPVDAFHANLIDKGRPPFDGWSRQDRDALLARAVDLLTDSTLCANLYAIGCTFVLDDLNALLPGGAVGRGRTHEIYERCYLVLFHNIRRFSPFAGIDFVFDRKAKAEGRVQTHFNDAKATLDADTSTAGILNTCRFEDDRTVVPLQAADLLAFEYRRRTWDRLNNAATPVRKAYQQIKDAFEPPSVNSKPPYRQRLFRCYDHTFVLALAAQMQAKPDMTDIEFLDLWFRGDAPED